MKYIRTLIQKIQKQGNIQTKGFTLIEALVSLGLFSIVVVSASGVILSVIGSNRKNQAISAVVNNLNYSIESMVRDIKTGYRYHCLSETDISGMTTDDFAIEAYKLRTESCTTNQTISSLTLISTITGKEQVVRYDISGTGDAAYIRKTLYNEVTSGSDTTVNIVSYPLTDQKNILISRLAFTVNTPQSLIPTPPVGVSVGQPSVFLVLTGTAKVNQINVSNFFIQTFISQRLPNFI